MVVAVHYAVAISVLVVYVATTDPRVYLSSVKRASVVAVECTIAVCIDVHHATAANTFVIVLGTIVGTCIVAVANSVTVTISVWSTTVTLSCIRFMGVTWTAVHAIWHTVCILI